MFLLRNIDIKRQSWCYEEFYEKSYCYIHKTLSLLTNHATFCCLFYRVVQSEGQNFGNPQYWKSICLTLFPLITSSLKIFSSTDIKGERKIWERSLFLASKNQRKSASALSCVVIWDQRRIFREKQIEINRFERPKLRIMNLLFYLNFLYIFCFWK